MHYTHVELLPIMEHPYDGSWGYQVCGYFAPTSRFGTPEDFKYFVNKMHEMGIGVILDWFRRTFRRTSMGFMSLTAPCFTNIRGATVWKAAAGGTRYFDVGRPEVQSFLISCALFWMREYHADGLRTDAVASMLYLDYDREPGEWIPQPIRKQPKSGGHCLFQKTEYGGVCGIPRRAYDCGGIDGLADDYKAGVRRADSASTSNGTWALPTICSNIWRLTRFTGSTATGS